MPSTSLLAVVLALALGSAACSGSGSGEIDGPSSDPRSGSTTSNESSTSQTSDRTSVAPSEIQTVDGPLGTAFDLAMGWLNGQPIDAISYEALFSDEFQATLGFDAFEATLGGLHEEGPWSVVDLFPSSDTALEALVAAGDGTNWLLTVVIEDPEQVVISTLLLSPAPEVPDVASVEEAAAQLGAAGQLRFLAAEVTDGTCSPIQAEAADQPAPLGSIFKLYVLGAVIDAVAAGALTWDTPVEIRSELFSVPSGITQNEEPGTELTVQELSERMISISDNTATDHLIDAVGREAVEEAMAARGHSDPTLNRPFLSTREFTILKFGDDAERRQQYIAGAEADRRAIVESLSAEPLPPITALIGLAGPVDVETIEWFASPNDLCEALIGLVEDDQGRRILGLSPGVPDFEGRWEYLGFKGGSEPGLLAMAWYGTTIDGSSYVVAGSVANDDQLLDEADLASLFGAARDLTPAAG